MKQAEKIVVKTDIVGCDGGEMSSGHPMVYLKIEKQRNKNGSDVICPYCSRRFIINN